MTFINSFWSCHQRPFQKLKLKLKIFDSQLNNGLPQVYVTNEKCVLNLPRTIVTLLSCTSRTPLSLVEQTYRVLHNYLLANNDQLFELIEPHIPQTIFERLQHGPTACCGNSNCEKPLFRECCFIVVRRYVSPHTHIFFSPLAFVYWSDRLEYLLRSNFSSRFYFVALHIASFLFSSSNYNNSQC